MTKPTPLFVASLIGLTIIILGLWLIASTYNYAMDARAEQLLQNQAHSLYPSPYPPKQRKDNEEAEQVRPD